MWGGWGFGTGFRGCGRGLGGRWVSRMGRLRLGWERVLGWDGPPAGAGGNGGAGLVWVAELGCVGAVGVLAGEIAGLGRASGDAGGNVGAGLVWVAELGCVGAVVVLAGEIAGLERASGDAGGNAGAGFVWVGVLMRKGLDWGGWGWAGRVCWLGMGPRLAPGVMVGRLGLGCGIGMCWGGCGFGGRDCWVGMGLRRCRREVMF